MSLKLKFAVLTTIIVVFLSFNVSAAITVIDNMDDASAWTGGTLETENIKEGTGAVRIDSAELLQFNRVFDEPMDLSMYEEDGVVSLWIYFEDVSVFADRDNSLEFTSSGVCDVEESGFTLDNWLFENGWNHLLIGMDEFVSYDADWSRINYIRFYKFTEGANTMIIDDIKIGTAADFGVGKVPVKDGATLFESFDSPDGFEPPNVEASANIEGTGAISTTSDELLSISKTYAEPVDMSRIAENGYAYIWVYIEDPSLLADGGAIEITSGGVYDVEETSWDLDDAFEFKVGWNELLLDVSQADLNECDFSRVNFIRVFMFTGGTNTMMLDKMYLGVGEDFGIRTEPPPETQAPEADTAADETDAEAEGTETAEGDSNLIMYIIIGVAVAAVVIIIIAAAVKSKKKA
ncbi:MAG: hypothetical protein PHZ09_00470 [Eubacteriales bacterium]|nr:hypothetical protein [Eubacteriales bacterium]